MKSTTFSSPAAYVRDRFTWLAYILFSFFSYMVIAIGPLMPFLRRELELSYTMGGLHLSLLALGGIPPGIVGDRLIQRFGRRRMLWAGSAGLAGGGILLTLSNHVLLSLTSVLIMGAMGAFIPIVVQAALSDHHQEQRVVALSEAQIVVMITAGAVPLMIGLGEYIGTGWRGALLLAVGVWLLVVFTGRTIPIPESLSTTTADTTTKRPLPAAFWGYWFILFLGVSIEWCVSLWGASFFIAFVGIAPATASTLMSLFFLGMIIGRIASRQLVRTYAINNLLLVAQATALVGFLLFWLSPLAFLNVAGLFIVGLGVAGLFPLAVSAGMSLVPDQATIASARVAVSASLAMLVMPFFLGWFADLVGLYVAYVMVIFLIGIIAALTLVLKALKR